MDNIIIITQNLKNIFSKNKNLQKVKKKFQIFLLKIIKYLKKVKNCQKIYIKNVNT